MDRNDKILAVAFLLIVTIPSARLLQIMSGTEIMTDVWVFLTGILNSNAFIAFASACTGALAGAYGAQRISERSKYKNDLIQEIRNTNAAITECFSLCNSFLTLKKQHVKPRKEYFDKQIEDFTEKERHGGLIEIVLDFQTIPTLAPGVDRLRSLIFEKISAQYGPLSLLEPLAQSENSLINHNSDRNEAIQSLKCQGDRDRTASYIGRRNEAGHLDTRYPDCMNGISVSLDDCIAFSILLLNALIDHGKALKQTYENSISIRGMPSLIQPNFNKATELGLMPDFTQYEDWAQNSKMKL